MCLIWFDFLMSRDTLILLDTASHNISWYNTIDRIYGAAVLSASPDTQFYAHRDRLQDYAQIFYSALSWSFTHSFFHQKTCFFIMYSTDLTIECKWLIKSSLLLLPFLFSLSSLLHTLLFHFVFLYERRRVLL